MKRERILVGGIAVVVRSMDRERKTGRRNGER